MDTDIYRLDFDTERFPLLVFDTDEEDIGLWMYDGASKLAGWVAPKLSIYENIGNTQPDLWHLVGASVLVLSESSTKFLGTFLTDAGELLPVECPEVEAHLSILNVLRVFDCVDLAASELTLTNTALQFKDLDRVPEGLFKAEGLETVHIFEKGLAFQQAVGRLGLSAFGSRSSGRARVGLFVSTTVRSRIDPRLDRVNNAYVIKLPTHSGPCCQINSVR